MPLEDGLYVHCLDDARRSYFACVACSCWRGSQRRCSGQGDAHSSDALRVDLPACMAADAQKCRSSYSHWRMQVELLREVVMALALLYMRQTSAMHSMKERLRA